MRSIKLPDTLSDCILVALADLEAVENAPGYCINMGTWHESHNDQCSVCLAGAVIAKTGDTPMNVNVTPWSFSEKTESKLLALDTVRDDVPEAVSCFYGKDGLADSDWYEMFPTVLYTVDPEAFKTRLRAIAAALKERGL